MDAGAAGAAVSPAPLQTAEILALGQRVLETEAQAILGLVGRLDGRFVEAVTLLAGCRGRVITTGMGKSGIICRKLAATLSSTGTPAFFLHPAEALHGDLGLVQHDDVVIALSHSGETAELLRLLEYIRRIGARLISLTGNHGSTLAQAADVALDCRVDEEACPMNLAPTASTTAALALGDALAMTLLVQKGFRAEHFANLHPGGKLGKRLLRADMLMHADAALPLVRRTTLMGEAVLEMTRKGLGMTCVAGDDGTLAGIITDGDLRRHLSDPGLLTLPAEAVMTRTPRTIAGSVLAVEALKLMEDGKISSLIVVDEERRVRGVLHLYDLWRTEMF